MLNNGNRSFSLSVFLVQGIILRFVKMFDDYKQLLNESDWLALGYNNNINVTDIEMTCVVFMDILYRLKLQVQHHINI